jgi:TonB family protein
MTNLQLATALACAGLATASAVWAGEPEPINPENWITVADNYPDADRLGLDGTVQVDLFVDEAGAVTGCRVVQGSGHTVLDEHTCTLLGDRARFRPATDEGGRAVPGRFRHALTWQVITNANWVQDGWVRAEVDGRSSRGAGRMHRFARRSHVGAHGTDGLLCPCQSGASYSRGVARRAVAAFSHCPRLGSFA